MQDEIAVCMSQQNTPSFDTPHFIQLLVDSKKALQHGEQLCSKAHELTFETSQVAPELMALDAKARWTSGEILEQLKVRIICSVIGYILING